MDAIARALGGIKAREDFRVVHFSIQDNHIHLLVEAHDTLALSRGMQALTIRMARALNRAASRTGKVFDDRYLRTHWPYGSGVWGKKEWVQPHVQDENVVSMLEGGTNLLWAAGYGKQLGLTDLWV